MSIPTQLTPDEKARAVTLRVNRQTRSATVEGLSAIYYGDTLVVLVDSIPGIDPSDMQLWLWKKEAGQTAGTALAQAATFASHNGSASRAIAEVPFTSTNLRDALVATPVGTPLICRLVIRESSMVIIDIDIETYPNPELTVIPTPDPDDVVANPFLRQDHFAAWATARLAEPLDNMDDMAAMITKILTKLANPTA